jgi:hypothetical protein
MAPSRSARWPIVWPASPSARTAGTLPHSTIRSAATPRTGASTELPPTSPAAECSARLSWLATRWFGSAPAADASTWPPGHVAERHSSAELQRSTPFSPARYGDGGGGPAARGSHRGGESGFAGSFGLVEPVHRLRQCFGSGSRRFIGGAGGMKPTPISLRAS